MITPPRYQKAQWDDVPQAIKTLIEVGWKDPATRKGIYIHGAVGAGKTHIAYGIAKYVQDDMRKRVTVWNSAELMNFIRESYDDKQKRWEVEELMDDKGLLIIDDIGSERVTEWTLEQFYLLVNKKYNEMMPVIFTSNYNVSDLSERIGERVASRVVEMCDVIELSGSDRRLG